MPDYAQTKSTFTNEYLTPIIDGARNDAVGLVDYVFRYANRLETSFASGDAVVDVGGMCVGSRKFETTAPINIPLTDNSYFVIYGYTKLSGTEESGIGVKFDAGDFPTLIQDDLQTNLTGRREVAIYRGFKSGGIVASPEDLRILENEVQKLVEGQKKLLLDSGTYNVNDTLGVNLDKWKEIEASFQSSAIARYIRSAEDPNIFWGTGAFVDGTPNQVIYGGNIAKVGSNWVLKASVQTRHRGGTGHDANTNQPIYNIRGVERL